MVQQTLLWHITGATPLLSIDIEIWENILLLWYLWRKNNFEIANSVFKSKEIYDGVIIQIAKLKIF